MVKEYEMKRNMQMNKVNREYELKGMRTDLKNPDNPPTPVTKTVYATSFNEARKQYRARWRMFIQEIVDVATGNSVSRSDPDFWEPELDDRVMKALQR
jgi:hypothetical protein